MASENFTGAVLIDPAVHNTRHAGDSNLNQGLGMTHPEAAAFPELDGRAPLFYFFLQHAVDLVAAGGNAAGAHADADEAALLLEP
jgi:hypothetical protein